MLILIEQYITLDGVCHFDKWFNSLKDKMIAVKVTKALYQLE